MLDAQLTQLLDVAEQLAVDVVFDFRHRRETAHDDRTLNGLWTAWGLLAAATKGVSLAQADAPSATACTVRARNRAGRLPSATTSAVRAARVRALVAAASRRRGSRPPRGPPPRGPACEPHRRASGRPRRWGRCECTGAPATHAGGEQLRGDGRERDLMSEITFDVRERYRVLLAREN